MEEQEKEAIAVTMASENVIFMFAQGPAFEKSVNALLKAGWRLEENKAISGKKVVFTAKMSSTRV